MVDILSTALNGLTASRNRALTNANNLANINTPGFRQQRLNTSDGPRGTGVTGDSVSVNPTNGAFVPTGNPTDLAIAGNGFFQVTDGAGNSFFTRDGAFTPNENGQLVNSQGLTLQPPVAIPEGTQSVSIAEDGTVTAQLAGGETENLGQVDLTNFSNPAGLSQQGGNLSAATGASGAPQTGAPGTGGRGFIVSGFLESSNVDIAQEMINLRLEANITRANVAVAKTADEMTQSAIDLVG